ncbi:helix-turn-helix domain-containing protein [Afipia carboxidovorans]|uniref:helix-turn-helix domain-containing protein n=1 Tax=Afipia carboxidovorans TaxID=40137 RepID=UPI00308B3F30|nr:hypothetical protein CRBSH125_35040 [Afipia carboxidovorans]
MLYVPTLTPEEKKQRESLKAARERFARAAYHPTPVEKITPKPEPELVTPRERRPYRLWFTIEEVEPLVLERHPSIHLIQEVVAGFYGVTRNDLLSVRRTANVVRPRQVAMYLAKTMTLRSLPFIGKHFGGRDHTTALHAVKKIGVLIETDKSLRAQVETIKSTIREAIEDHGSITPGEDSGNENVASGREASKPSPDRNGIDAARSDDAPAQG